jgi:AcrR family transcriptional regulator
MVVLPMKIAARNGDRIETQRQCYRPVGSIANQYLPLLLELSAMKSTRNSVNPSQAAPDLGAASAESRNIRWGNEIQSRDEQGGLKRFAILRTAAELFNERGFYETSLNELAKRLNVTKPSLYYYVKNKDDILLQILNQAVIEFQPAMNLAEESGLCGREKLKIFITQYTAAMTGVFGKCMVLSGLGPLEPSSRDELTPTFRRLDTFVRKLLEEGIQDGSIVPCDTKITAFSIFGSMHWLARWYRPDGELNAQEIADRVFMLFELGLKPIGNHLNTL